ncbi:hypothetical protein B7Y94_05725 [Candidatus Saccharibacteria bacterium 32-49-12]|nr:MAG: hypothetical protein B7Y94_05725 [Candidatus Saccharibacteria bacterium 32-49-12]
MRKGVSGFTIVELLIVIVVIGTLAAISIVAYNGVQAKARYAQQVSELDRIGRAIQLWSAENGKSLGSSGAGASGAGIGHYTVKSSPGYTAVSVEDLLQSSGYLSGEINQNAFTRSSVMLAPCTTYDNVRWVVLATVSPAPPKTPAEQITDTGCTSPTITTYTGTGYNRNLIKAYQCRIPVSYTIYR